MSRQPSNGQKINRQLSKTEYFYRQPSNERTKISRRISQISLNDRDRLTKWGHHLVEQAIKVKVYIRANVAHQAGAYPGFCSMKRLGVFLLPPGWDASPSQGYSPALSSPIPIHTPGWREAL